MTKMFDAVEGCQWLGAENSTGYHCACTQPVVAGRSYCEEHLWTVYQKGTAVNRRKDRRTAEQVWDVESAFHEAVAELEAEGWDFSL
jgi:hypothetical protein